MAEKNDLHCTVLNYNIIGKKKRRKENSFPHSSSRGGRKGGHFSSGVVAAVPWEPEVFLSCGRNFRCWLKAEAAGHYKDLTETGNRARNVSGTQGMPAEERFNIERFSYNLEKGFGKCSFFVSSANG